MYIKNICSKKIIVIPITVIGGLALMVATTFAMPEEAGDLISKFRVNRGALQAEILAMSRKIQENAQELRNNFRDKVKTEIGRVDHRRTTRIAIAHGWSLKMLNRFRSAIVRFDHIMGRIDSRIEKIETRGVNLSSTVPLIEEAKDIQIENKITMEELKLKYESLLEGKNPKGIGEEAREIAKTLKAKIKNLQDKLLKIVAEIKRIDSIAHE